jgi:putative component of membrane protein insertase Oxa1/YidC/SpoIIIJ protein YidD
MWLCFTTIDRALAWALVAAIRLYRAVACHIPRTRSCLFAVSCSRHVEAAARERGLAAGLLAMHRRFAACRPGYNFEFEDDRWRAVCVDSSAIADSEASQVVREEAAACLLTLRSVVGDVHDQGSAGQVAGMDHGSARAERWVHDLSG